MAAKLEELAEVYNVWRVGTKYTGPSLREWLLEQPPEFQVRWDEAEERGELEILPWLHWASRVESEWLKRGAAVA